MLKPLRSLLERMSKRLRVLRGKPAGPREILAEVVRFVEGEIAKAKDPRINKATIKPDGGAFVVERPNGQKLYIWATARQVHVHEYGNAEAIKEVAHLKMCCSKPSPSGEPVGDKACFDYKCRLDQSVRTHILRFLERGLG